MSGYRRIVGTGLLLLAVVVAGCQTTPPKGRGKLCIDVIARRAGNAMASVYIDGTKECEISMVKGKSFFLFCPAGKHMLRVESKGYLTYEKEIKVRRNETSWLNIKLRRPTPEEVAEAKAEAEEAKAKAKAEAEAKAKADAEPKTE